VGQSAATEAIVPYVQMYQAGMAPEGRPVGVFLLLGPTGTGKTKTVEALAEVLHGSEKSLLKIDCGEFQMEHEVAKLIGAPPGYLGHRETQPLLSQQKLAAVTSEDCGLSIVLFDEIEKAAPSLTRLLLGVLDKAVLRLGDNTHVNFENSIIFLTSNLGADQMMKELRPNFGFQSAVRGERSDLEGKLDSIGLTSVRKKFSPEFVNRIDRVITYHPLDDQALNSILDLQLEKMQAHISRRLGDRAFSVSLSGDSRDFLLRKGTSPEYGARELNRTIHRELMQPLASMVVSGQVANGAQVSVDLAPSGDRLVMEARIPEPRSGLNVLIVDDSPEMLQFFERQMSHAGWKLITASSVAEALQRSGQTNVSAALIDHVLEDGSGIHLGLELRRQNPMMPVILMSGLALQRNEQKICMDNGFTVLRKPFIASDVVNQIQAALDATDEPDQLRAAS
jgi:CheY-like chemotaxis protein